MSDRRNNQIDYVEIPAPDMEKAKAFYSAVFGWTLQDFGGDYCCFDDQRLTGAFSAERQVGTAAKGGPLIVIYVDSIEATREKILTAGGREIVPKFAFPGGHRAHVTDPNGNELSVWSPE